MPSSNANIFLLGDQVHLSSDVNQTTLFGSLTWGWIVATIQGKVNDSLYTVSVSTPTESSVQHFVDRYGLPNRHLKLEWGGWKGWDCEFVVPAEDLRK
jgi:hypothetical protein